MQNMYINERRDETESQKFNYFHNFSKPQFDFTVSTIYAKHQVFSKQLNCFFALNSQTLYL
jgi:hypothetical protein